MQIRFIPVDELVLNFAQIAVRFQTAQKLRLVKKSGELIRETEERAIEDIWVFERVTNFLFDFCF